MRTGAALRRAREGAGLSQQELARRAGTSQATLSAYETAAKEPSLRTLERLLGAAGARLTVQTGGPGWPPDPEQAGRRLAEVLALAEALPARPARRVALPAPPAMTLAERIRALHHALEQHKVPHAFGGAVALAYATEEPRGTRDIDLNVFVPTTRAADVLGLLPAGISQPAGSAETLARDGQIRLFWDDTPVDIFLDYAPIHDEAARHRRNVPFEGETIPVLGPIELAVFKAMFDRLRDWGDLEEMAKAGMLDFDAVQAALVKMVGTDDERLLRLDEVARRAALP